MRKRGMLIADMPVSWIYAIGFLVLFLFIIIFVFREKLIGYLDAFKDAIMLRR
jgi:hypothetical protein